MLKAGVRFDAAEAPIPQGRSGSGSAMAELFLPLDHLLGGGGDPRLSIDAASGVNGYGCRPFPCPDTLSFASSTATSISQRGYDAAFDARIEAMRGELKACLGLSRADVVFSPSGTDSQLQALWLARTLLGPELTTVIVAADQTGSGTVETARGNHFSAATANGSQVRKGEPIAGLAHSVASVALPLLDAAGEFRTSAETDAQVLGAIEQAIANGGNVLLQIMDSSKLGWRAPSQACLDEIAARWPDRVQIIVDACQMRLGRQRLQHYLDRGYMVIVTGSKFFTGPPFSGALLVPQGLSNALDAVPGVAPGLRDYSSRSDWPMHWRSLRSHFPVRANFGQWLRWEAALEEIRAYYEMPREFRSRALTGFGDGVQRIIASSPSLDLLPPQQRPEHSSLDDEELVQPTIFAFVIRHNGRALALNDCRKIYRALARDARTDVSADARARDPEIAAQVCLIGQPVALGESAALRICAGARLVTECWSSDENIARQNLQRELGHVGAVVAKIERLLANMDIPNLVEVSRGA
jgi:hypothetical protein